MSKEWDNDQDKAQALNRSALFDFGRWSQAYEFERAIWFFIKGCPDIPKSTSYTSSYVPAFNVILSNLFATHKAHKEAFIAHSRSAGHYSKKAINPAKLGYKSVIKVLRYLEDGGYIINYKGYLDRQFFVPKGFTSRMRATEKLVDCLENDFGITLSMIGRHPKEPTILLKSAKDEEGRKHFIMYNDTDFTLEAKQNLSAINNHLGKFRITLDLSSEQLASINYRRFESEDKDFVDFSKLKLRRIFNNGSFEQGGRFYGGWWQNVPREFRRCILIDGKVTAEADYSALHPTMLYYQKGLSMQGDPYALEGIENTRDNRQFIKATMLRMINADSQAKAKASILEEVAIGDLVNPGLDVDDIIWKIKERHKPIADSFLSGVGIKLQAIDSKLAEQVMLRFCEKDLPCFPVHDSFITWRENRVDLAELMKEVYFKMFAQEIRVDIKS